MTDPRFAQAEQRYRWLKAELEAGRLTAEGFESALWDSQLEFDGRWWMLGANTGHWYAFDGQRWVERRPPESSTAGPTPTNRPPPPPVGPQPSQPPAGGSPTVPGSRKRWPLIAVGLAAFVAIALVVGYLVFKGDGEEAAKGEILLQPVASDGPFPWTSSLVPPNAPTSVPLPPPTTAPPAPGLGPNPLVGVTGDRAGIYGGSLNISVCDKPKLISFLEQNSAQRSAWAGVLGITDVRAYVDSLSPVILSADTRVTNHGFRDGKAFPLQSVLQAGTAVLVDKYGVPRVRCYCGNPLLPPVLSSSSPKYTGQPWSGFDPGRIVVVQAAPAPLTQITIINVNGGGSLVIPVGGTNPPAPQQQPPPPQQPAPPQQQPRPPAAQVLRLASITVTRTYGGQLTSGQPNAVQPGTSTVDAGDRQFQVGWDYNWGPGGVNRNRAVATVTLTQAPATITVGQPAAIGATMSGEWLQSGYGVDRARTIALSGAAGSKSQNFGGPPSGSVQGTITASGTTQPGATSSGATPSVSAAIRFGDDHTGDMVIALNYRP